eukprot:gene10995-35625_t
MSSDVAAGESAGAGNTESGAFFQDAANMQGGGSSLVPAVSPVTPNQSKRPRSQTDDVVSPTDQHESSKLKVAGPPMPGSPKDITGVPVPSSPRIVRSTQELVRIRSTILDLVTRSNEVPTTKVGLADVKSLDWLSRPLQDAEINRALSHLEKKDKSLVSVGKKQGKYRGWILPQHEAQGSAFFEAEEKRDAASKQQASAAARGPKEHDVRREAIVGFVSDGDPTIPKRKPEIIAHVKESVPEANDSTVGNDLRELVKTGQLKEVGKSQGQYRGWILPQHEALGTAFFEAEMQKHLDARRQAAATARGPQAHDVRREAIVGFVTSGNPTIPKRKTEIIAHVQKSVPEANDSTVGNDLRGLVKDGQLKQVGKSQGQYCGWILPQHEALGTAFFEAEEKGDVDARRQAAATARGPKEHDLRRAAIVGFVTSGNPTIPKRKTEIIAHVQKSVPEANDSTVGNDLRGLVKDGQLKQVGKSQGQYSGWILPQHEALGTAYFEAEMQKHLDARRQAAADARGPQAHEVRRAAIVGFVSSGDPTIPKRKPEILGMLDGVNERTIDADLLHLVGKGALKAVGKKAGKRRGWILPEHAEAGKQHFIECAMSQKKKKGEDGEIAKRRKIVLDFFQAQPKVPKRKAELMQHLKGLERYAEVTDSQVGGDLTHLAGVADGSKTSGGSGDHVGSAADIAAEGGLQDGDRDSTKKMVHLGAGLWILACYEEDGLLAIEQKKDEAEKKKQNEMIERSVFRKRRQSIVDFVGSGPKDVPKSRKEIAEYLKDSGANESQINLDLRVLSMEASSSSARSPLVLIGLARSTNRCYALAENEAAVKEAQQKRREERAKRFDKEQIKKLVESFEKNPSPSLEDRTALQTELGSKSLLSITNWFRRRRDKVKQKATREDPKSVKRFGTPPPEPPESAGPQTGGGGAAGSGSGAGAGGRMAGINLQTWLDEKEWPGITLERFKLLLENDPSVEVVDSEDAGYTIKLCVQPSDDDETDYDSSLDALSDDDDGTDVDDVWEEIATNIVDSKKLFMHVKHIMKRARDGRVPELADQLSKACTPESMDEWLDPNQRDEFESLCNEATKRSPWVAMKECKPGKPGFNAHATNSLKHESAALLDGKNFQMHGKNYHMLKCSECSKSRDVGPGPAYYNADEENWTCASEGSPVAESAAPCSEDEVFVSQDLILQPYQKTVEFLVHPFGPIERLLVAHRTGAGKTITMIKLLDNYFYDERPKVVVLPTRSTVDNFYEALLATPSKYLDYFKAEIELGLGLESLASKKREDRVKVRKELERILKMRKFYRKGRASQEKRELWIQEHDGCPLPAAPILVLSYARAGGTTVENRRVFEFRIEVEGDAGDAPSTNPYDDKVVLMDEAHNLTMWKPDLERYRGKIERLAKWLKHSQRTVLVGLTATPVEKDPADVRGLLDVIKGKAAVNHKFNDEGFVSYFGASPPSLFPKVDPDGVPSYSIPEVIEVPLSLTMRAKYISKSLQVRKRLGAPDQDHSLTTKLKAKLPSLLVPYCSMSVFYARTKMTIQPSSEDSLEDYSARVLSGFSDEVASKLHRIADDVISDWSADPNTKSIVLIDRTCGWEALFHLIRSKVDKQGGLLDPKAIKAYPPPKSEVAGGIKYLKPGEPEPAEPGDVLKEFNQLTNSGGGRVSILIVDSKEAAEGVSFMAVRRLYLATPPLSWLSFQQLVGRAVRSFSHSALEPHQRTVSTKLYVATFPQVDVACDVCMKACNEGNGVKNVLHCPKCNLFFCCKSCALSSNTFCSNGSSTCIGSIGKVKVMKTSHLNEMKTMDEILLGKLAIKVQEDPPLRELEMVAVDRATLLEVDEISNHVTASTKIIREARLRKMMKKKRTLEEQRARQHQEQTEDELKVEIERLNGVLQQKDAVLGKADLASLAPGYCWGCQDTKEQIIKCGNGHELCVQCFQFQFRSACSEPSSILLDKIGCAYDDEGTSGECKHCWTFSDALKYVSREQEEELKDQYWKSKKEQKELLESGLNQLEAKRKELEAAIRIECPAYWTDCKRVEITQALREPFTMVDMPWREMKLFQAIIDGLTIAAALGRGADQKVGGQYSRMKVQEVKRVENPYLWMRYQSAVVNLRANQAMLRAQGQPDSSPVQTKTTRNTECKELMRSNKLRSDLNEVYLFHGTSGPVSSLVMRFGHNERFAADGLWATQKGLKMPAEISGGLRHTSLIGEHGHHREFIVYDGLQAYPEYLILYKRA